MKQTHLQSHWVGRLLASDPGRKRFQKAGKATISLISSVCAMLIILKVTGHSMITPAIVSGVIGMMSIMVVMDDTKKKQQMTTLLLGIMAACGISIGTLLSANAYYVSALMLIIIFCAFYFSRFGVRFFSIGMVGFLTVYISSLLGFSPSLLPWFYLGIGIGLAFAFLYNFILFKDSDQVLKRSMRSFHIQANLTFNILITMIQQSELSQERTKYLIKNVQKLREYARNVSDDLKAQDVNNIWPGLNTSQLRLYVFDTAMLLESLTDAIQRMKKDDVLDTAELKQLLVRVVESLRNAEVLDQSYEQQNLVEAEQAVQALHETISNLINREAKPPGRLFLFRRVELIADHVIDGALSIQASLNQGEKTEEHSDDEEDNSEEDDQENDEEKNKDKGLKSSTKKAYQALVAGVISIIVGYIISPTQPYWVLLTSFIVQLGTESVGRTYIKGFQRSLGTIIGAILGFGLAKIVSGQSFVEVILLFVVIFLAFYLVTVSYTVMSLLITMLIAFMYDILLGGITYQLLGARVMDTIAGAAVALGVSTIIFPKKTKHKVADAVEGYLDVLNPYVTDYVKGFRESINVKELTGSAFELDQKLQSIKDEAQSLLQGPGALRHAGIARWITFFTAINYYAKHLVASSYQKDFDYPDELETVFKQIEEKLEHNMNTLVKLIKGTEHTSHVFHLKKEREQIERLAAERESQGDLNHHLFYVWRINRSIVTLCGELGAKEE